jgi:hypothetical protein
MFTIKLWLTEVDYKDNYPRNFDDNLISFDCGIGWKSLIDELFESIKDTDTKISQIKEKFGTLRIYLDNASSEINKKVSELEKRSSKICEFCGSIEGVTTEGSWLKTLCKICRKNKNSS